MAYTVLARKYRPQVFREMVGQEHVLKALINALDHNRLHHAYLFTGTRGVGKTTVARVLAKCFNCDQGVSSEPCGVCSACQEIAEGRSVDLIEVDAASRTKVEDTRELLENVQYAPTRSRFKIYLIDEVHMLSSHSFNALLKTLEEPPEHAKFLLATTDPQKLPATILSRCLQFHLKNLSPDRISAYLAHVLEREMIQAEPAGLAELGRAAEGSMRDALSLTDQAIAFGGGQVRATDVSSMLGSIGSGNVLPVLDALQQGQAKAMLDAVGILAEHGAEFGQVIDTLLQWLHQIALCQWVPATLEQAQMDAQALARLADAMAPQDVQLYYQMLSSGRPEVANSSDSKASFEMLLLRLLAFRPAIAFSEELVDFEVSPTHNPVPLTSSLGVDASQDSPRGDARPQVLNTDSVGATGESSVESPVLDSAPPWDEPSEVAAEAEVNSPSYEPAAEPDWTGSADPKTEETNAKKPEALAPLESLGAPFTLSVASWPAAFIDLGLTGILYNVASHCECVRVTDTAADFCLDEHNASLFNESHVAKLESALAQAEGVARKVSVVLGSVRETPAGWLQRRDEERLQRATEAMTNDPVVQALCQTFDAHVVPNSIKTRLH